MLTLQKTFAYEGDARNTPFDNILLKFKIPIYAFEGTISEINPFKNVLSTVDFHLQKKARDKEYSLSVPTINIIGSSINSMLNCYKRQFLHLLPISVESVYIRFESDNYSFPVNVEFFAGKSNIGKENFEAIPCFKLFTIYKEIKQLTTIGDLHGSNNILSLIFYILRNNVNQIFNETHLQPLRKTFEKNTFLINKNSINEFSDKFVSFLDSSHQDPIISSLITFLAIQRLCETKNFEPTRLDSFTAFTNKDLNAVKNLFKDITGADEELPIDNENGLLEFLDKNFQKLFDFPIRIPALKVKSIDIAGTFHVYSNESVTVTKEYLLFYNLSVELQNIILKDEEARILHHDWTENNNIVSDNMIAFSFPMVETFMYDESNSQAVTVNVKDFIGAVLLTKDYNPGDPDLKNIEINIPLRRPNSLTTLEKKGTTETGKRLRGQLLELGNKCSLNEITIVVQAKKEGDLGWRIVGAANTDKSGNFSMPYPFGDFVAAQALVSVSPDKPADIVITSERKGQTISDDFLYLLIDGADCSEQEKENDCDCHAPKKASRLPDQKDLIASDEYTQDIGGSCINLSTPNRTLNEYSYKAIVRTSDPDVANYSLVKSSDGKFTLEGGANKINRSKSKVDLNNPIRWQDAPESNENLTIYQSVTVATGHILHYRSEFRADGYSLGNLLYSLPLAPGQKKQIVVFDSVHSLQGAETQIMTQRESLAAGIVNERSITDQISGSISEFMQGSSSASTGGVSAGLGIGGQMGMFGGALGVSGGYANSSSAASQDSYRNISQFFGE